MRQEGSETYPIIILKINDNKYQSNELLTIFQNFVTLIIQKFFFHNKLITIFHIFVTLITKQQNLF